MTCESRSSATTATTHRAIITGCVAISEAYQLSIGMRFEVQLSYPFLYNLVCEHIGVPLQRHGLISGKGEFSTRNQLACFKISKHFGDAFFNRFTIRMQRDFGRFGWFVGIAHASELFEFTRKCLGV